MIASVHCGSCGHDGPTAHHLGAEQRGGALFIVRMAARSRGWAVGGEAVETGPIVGVCPRCRAHRGSETIWQEVR